MIDLDVLGTGYDPYSVFWIIRDNVKLLGLFDRDHRIFLSMNEQYRLVHLLYRFDRPDLAKIGLEESAPASYAQVYAYGKRQYR